MTRKFFVLFVCILLTLSFCSCKNKAKEKVISVKTDVPHTIDSVTYQTSDGIWQEKDVNEMIKKYCAEKATVDITVSITFTAKESFYCAIATCDFITTPVKSENTESIEFRSTKSFISMTDNKDGVLLNGSNLSESKNNAGTYTLTIQAGDICFYGESTKKDNDITHIGPSNNSNNEDYKITTCVSEILTRLEFIHTTVQ